VTDRPRVVIVSRRMERKNKLIDWVSEVHLSLLIQERLLPVIVPIAPEAANALPSYAREMDGLLLVEGGDIEPRRYRSSATTVLDEVDPLKDAVEIRLCRVAIRRGLPILGICRGMQLLNVVCGGTLHLDVRKERGTTLEHVDHAHYDEYRHPLSVEPGTPLHRWYRATELSVNSYHHQGVKRLARRFRPMAHSPDGLVEAYHEPDHRFRVGLQFHPERMLPEHPGNRRVFAAFGRAVREGARGGRAAGR
jgi:gamma-glutamyl-gamma-aminobutyrate hydrolase PuuD